MKLLRTPKLRFLIDDDIKIENEPKEDLLYFAFKEWMLGKEILELKEEILIDDKD
jgi:hypothetical protein